MHKLNRSILVLLSFAIFGAGAVILNFTVFPLAKYFIKKENLLYFYSDIIHKSWKWFVNWLITTKVIRLNIEDISTIKNKVIAATHPSFIDVLILIALIPRTTCVVKHSLSKNPILTNLISSIFILDNDNLDSIKSQTKMMIEKGFNIIIFPSGTRHRKNEFPKIKKGAGTIAMNANVNIICLKYHTDFDFLFINQPIYEAGEKPVTYELTIAGEINTSEEMKKSDSEIAVKKNITKMIENMLYK